jgi:hypothetical protein
MPTNTKKQRTVLILSAFALVFAVGTAGCAKDEDPTVATANPSAKASAGSKGDSEASPLKFSQCMRDQGLTWYPDPQPDGGLVVHNPEGVDQSKVDKAEETCKKYNPAENRTGTISAEDLDRIRQMSQCIRDHGFPKYPDPDANGGIQIDEKATGISHDDPAFEKARQECQKYLPAPKSKGSS